MKNASYAIIAHIIIIVSPSLVLAKEEIINQKSSSSTYSRSVLEHQENEFSSHGKQIAQNGTCSGPGSNRWPYGAEVCFGYSPYVQRCTNDGSDSGSWVQTSKRCPGR